MRGSVMVARQALDLKILVRVQAPQQPTFFIEGPRRIVFLKKSEKEFPKMKKPKKENHVIFSVIGTHAGESEEEIFRRKTEDINRVGFTLWLYKSSQVKPNTIQDFCKKAKKGGKSVFIFFIKPSSSGSARPTKIELSAKSYSVDNKKWKILPKKLTPVTGEISKGAYALILYSLKEVSSKVNLWDYADFLTEKAIKIRLGNSTLCAFKKDTSREISRMKSSNRKIIAIGELRKPWCVWLK